jgi:hypothetical protein
VYNTPNEEDKRSVDQLINVEIQFPDVILEQRVRDLIENVGGFDQSSARADTELTCV